MKTADGKWLGPLHNYTLRLYLVLVLFTFTLVLRGRVRGEDRKFFQFSFVVESIWIFTMDSFRTTIIMLSAQEDPPIASTKGISGALIGVLAQRTRHSRGERLFFFTLLSRVSRVALLTPNNACRAG